MIAIPGVEYTMNKDQCVAHLVISQIHYLPANNMCHAHAVIIQDICKMIRRKAVGFEQYLVIDYGILEAHRSVDEVRVACETRGDLRDDEGAHGLAGTASIALIVVFTFRRTV